MSSYADGVYFVLDQSDGALLFKYREILENYFDIKITRDGDGIRVTFPSIVLRHNFQYVSKTRMCGEKGYFVADGNLYVISPYLDLELRILNNIIGYVDLLNTDDVMLAEVLVGQIQKQLVDMSIYKNFSPHISRPDDSSYITDMIVDEEYGDLLIFRKSGGPQRFKCEKY